MWLLSTGLKNEILKRRGWARHGVAAATISFGDGDGAGGRDTINDSGSGLAGFIVGDYVTILGGTNDGVMARVLSVVAGKLEVAAGTFAAESAGSSRIVVACSGGCIQDIFRNCVGAFYTGSRPASADDAEVGTKLALITKDKGAFVSGSPGNGLNLADAGSLSLGLEIDPLTGVSEVWSGDGLATGAANSFWLYANTVIEGASSSSIRMIGRVAVSGVEVNMAAGTTITQGVPVTGVTVNLTL